MFWGPYGVDCQLNPVCLNLNVMVGLLTENPTGKRL